jgi:hypothetical protein
MGQQKGLGDWAPPPPPRKATQVGLGIRADRTTKQDREEPAELPKKSPTLVWGEPRPQAPQQLGLDVEPQRGLFGGSGR